MYTLYFYHMDKLQKTESYNDENRAQSSLVEYASWKDLTIAEDYYSAYSDGNKPETFIELIQEEDAQ